MVPTDDEIKEAVKNLRRNTSGGPLGIRAEHLKGGSRRQSRRNERRLRKGKGRRTMKKGGRPSLIGRDSYRRRSGRDIWQRSPHGRRWF